MKPEAYKIWKNPEHRGESPKYLGDFYPPKGQVCFFNSDLTALGFGAGDYTIRVPSLIRKIYALPEWQKVSVIE